MINPKTNVEWFKHLLYSDHEFLAQKELYDKWRNGIEDDQVLIIFNMVWSKETSLKKSLIGHLGNCLGAQLIEATAKRFEVPEHVVEYGFIKRPDLFGVSRDRDPYYFTGKDSKNMNIKPNEIYIRVYANTRFEDLETIWPLVKREQQKFPEYTPQSKATFTPGLVYAIYKQRLINENGKREHFEVIFKMYQHGKLPGYDGSTTSHNSSDSLERHFRRHMPKPDTM